MLFRLRVVVGERFLSLTFFFCMVETAKSVEELIECMVDVMAAAVSEFHRHA